MSILAKLMGRHSGNDYRQGIALFEAGRFAEAVQHLRPASKNEAKKSGSLADFYLRQALTREGKRLLIADQADDALPFLREAAERWPGFPDLHFWFGVALAQAGRWPDVQDAAQAALSCNSDYIEARLLEACALAMLGEATRAANSLNALLASGLRVEHRLIRYLAGKGPFSEDTIPANLLTLLQEGASKDTNRDEIAAAVDECRSGNWEQGLAHLHRLRDDNPTYPDLRVKLAAALFQTGRNDEAMQEVDQAIMLNPRYRSALHLKTLILADQHRFAEARDIIMAQRDLTDPVVGHPGEELFCSYLGGVLSFLVGHYDESLQQLGQWRELQSTFPMATLLGSAISYFKGNDSAALDGLEMLVEKWPGDRTYRYHLACFYLELGYRDALRRLIDEWPVINVDQADDDRQRLELLDALLRLDSGNPTGATSRSKSESPAWQLLRARQLAARGQYVDAYLTAKALADQGPVSERLAQLLLGSYLALDDTGEIDLPDTRPDSLLAMHISLLHRREKTADSLALLHQYQQLHPENLRWIWLDPYFWLEPVRRWIG